MLVAVYGSLRKGMGNYYHFLDSPDVKYIKTEWVFGYKMYSLGAYPYIIPGNGMIRVEFYDVPLDIGRSITSMELGAGYYCSEIDSGQGNACLYVYLNKWHGRRNVPEVKSGDWVEYKSKEVAYGKTI